MSYQRIRFSALKQMAMGRLGNVSFYNRDTEIPLYINEALRMWNVATWQWRGSYSWPTVPNQIFYTISAQILKPLRITYNGSPLDLTSLFSLDNGAHGWQADSSIPDSWFPVGLTQIGLHPADSAGANTLLVEGVVKAPVLLLDADYLDLGDWQVQAILDYVQHVAALKQGGEEFKATEAQLKNFVESAGLQNAKFKASAIYRRYMGLDLDLGLNPQGRQEEQRGN
jgi:hypothetical protein